MAKKLRKHRRVRRHRSMKPPGAAPGTLTHDPEAPKPVIHVFGYGPEKCHEQRIDNVRSLREMIGKWPVLWVNVEGLGDAKVVSEIGEIFNLHPLALEDVLNVHQRPKVEEYPDNLFIVLRMASLHGGVLETEQIGMFQGKNFIITFQEHGPVGEKAGDPFGPIRDRIRKGVGRVREGTADYFAYCLIDAIIDHYFPILEEFGEKLESLEDEVLLSPTRETVARMHMIKRDLLTLRRAMWPMRDTLNSLLRGTTPLVSASTQLYLRDCYDHTVRIIDLIEMYRELGADLMDVYLSSISNRMNEIMKVLTVIATIFIPLTFITGLYGMNFNTEKSPWNMPELNWRFGYPAVLLVMVTIAAGLLYAFRRRGWLGELEPKNLTNDQPPIPGQDANPNAAKTNSSASTERGKG